MHLFPKEDVRSVIPWTQSDAVGLVSFLLVSFHIVESHQGYSWGQVTVSTGSFLIPCHLGWLDLYLSQPGAVQTGTSGSDHRAGRDLVTRGLSGENLPSCSS